MTYGRLIDGAKRQLHRSVTAPLAFPHADDALVLCDARARLYRVLAGGLALHLDLPRTGLHQRFLEYRGDGIKRREATLLALLRADLLRSARTAVDSAPTPPTLSNATTRVTRAADLAGAAFDLLAGHLTPADARVAPSSAPLRRGGTRITASDAVQLARTLAQLDRKLELPLRSVAHTDPDQQTLRRLIATADDCKRVNRDGVQEFATAIHHILRTPDRQVVDDLDLAEPPTALHPTPADPSAAAELLTQLRLAVKPRPDRLSIPDLAAVAVIASRTCALIAYACAPIDGPVGLALSAAGGWWAVHQDLAPFATPSHGRNLIVYAHRFRGWADPLIRHGDQVEFANPVWLPAIGTMTADLAGLADSAVRAIETKLTAGDLLVRFDPDTRGREHLYSTVGAGDARVARLRATAAAAHQAARRLAQAVHESPRTSGRPARIPKALKRLPVPRPAAGRRTPPPPPPQPPGSNPGRRGSR